MRKVKNNQLGFSAVAAVLLIVIAGIIGFVGWYVWNSNQVADKAKSDTAKATSSSAQASKKTASATSAKPYDGWQSATLQYEKISYQYPADWTVADDSTAHPKSANECTYPGHDKVTLTSPAGSKFSFNAGQSCFGSHGEINYGSTPITALGQDQYLVFLGSSMQDPAVDKAQPYTACLAESDKSESTFSLKSKNIFFNGPGGGSEPVNSFCYTPKNVTSVSTIKSSTDYAAATMIFESLKY